MKRRVILIILITGYLSTYAAKVDTVRVHSESMNKSIRNVVITPDSYVKQKKEFPVLYLLHGALDDYSGWLKRVPEIKEYADQYQMIIVCPDASLNSWYFDSPIDDKMKYETYVSSELVPWIDQHYKTIATKKKRAITGLSMGGHGAFYLAFRHQDVWGAAGSMSGGVDIRPFPNNWDIKLRLGKYSDHKDNWEHNTVINMLHLLDGKALKLFFDCGVDDFFYEANNRLHRQMLQRKIPHTYIERPGRHKWDYWRNAIKYQLLYFNDFFNTAKI